MQGAERYIENLEDILKKGRVVIEQASKLLLDTGKKEEYISLISYLRTTSEINFAVDLEAKYNAESIEFWTGINPILAAKIAKERKDFDAAIRIYEKEECFGDAMIICAEAQRYYSKTDPKKAKYYEGKAHIYVSKLRKECENDIGPIGPCF